MDTRNFIGKKVYVEIDRPLGSRHPQYGNIYPLNYGFVPNTISGDGAEIDAYILGEFEPLEDFEGVVIAVIRRTNDNDDKLVVVREGKTYNEDQIKALTEFQERYFNSKIIF